MTRLPAILFLCILVFNFVGYRVVISHMEKSGDAAFEKKVDRQEYNEEELVTIKTKLNLPYYSSSPTFERTYGSITIDGVAYEYVQRRVYNDTLELRCLPNTVKTGLRNATNELTKSSADGQASVPVKKAPSTLKLSLPDFCQQLETISTVTISVKKTHPFQNEAFIRSCFAKRHEKPPTTMVVLS